MNIRSIPKPVLLISLLILSILITEAISYTSVFRRLELWSFDTRAQITRGDKSINDKIAVVLIDESSLKALDPIYGRFPWPRSAYADLLSFLSMGKPRAVIFDVLFSEHESDASAAERGASADDEFIRATSRYPYVIDAAQLFHDDTIKSSGADKSSPLPPAFAKKFGLPLSTKHGQDNNSYVLPMTGLWKSAAGVGIVNIQPDIDGVIRRMDLFKDYGGRAYPALSISPLLRLGDISRLPDASRQWLKTSNGRPYIVNMYGKYHPYSIAGLFASWSSLQNGDVQNLLVNPAEFKDKYVFIGANAVGLNDIKSTSILSTTPGVYIHASVLSNLLSGDILHYVPEYYVFILGALLALSALLLILYSQRWYLGYLVPVFAILAYLYTAVVIYAHNYVIPVVEPTILVLISIFLGSGYKAITEGRDRRRVKHMFSQYVSTAVLDELLEKYQDHISAGDGTRQQVTILFSDIRGFTSLSENLPPEKVVELLNIYLGEMSKIIMQDGGTIDKFIGDAIMAFWGAPVISGDHADKAVTASLEMVSALDDVNQQLNDKGFVGLKVGIGLHTGYAILGNIGSENKLDYTVIGDTVNLASRVEGLTKQYGCPVLLTEDTRTALAQNIPLGIVDAVKVKGKNIPIKLYAPAVDGNGQLLSGAAADAEVQLMEQGFTLYRTQDWQAAVSLYAKLQNRTLADKYISRCEHYIEQPPADDWDGVFVHTTK